METLKEYYENKLRVGEMEPFEQLCEGERQAYEKSFGFALYKASRAFDELKQEINKSLCLN